MFMAFKSELLQAIALHQQTLAVINPSVSVDKQDVSNAMNTISTQVSQVQIALTQFAQIQGTLEKRIMDRISSEVQKATTTTQPPTLGHTQYSPWHLYPCAPHSVPPSLYPSAYLHPSYLYLSSSYPHPPHLHPLSYFHPSYPHLSYPHPSYPRPPTQQSNIPHCGSHPSPHYRPISTQPTHQI